MSFSTIRIYRDLPVIDKYVQLPPNREPEMVKTTEAAALAIVLPADPAFLSLGSGRDTGSHFGQQEWVRLPPIHPNTWYTSDPIRAMGGNI